MNRRRGFTLVELLVVIAIIAVLLAILLPSLARVKELGKRLRCANNLKANGMAFRFYGDTYDGKLPQLEYNTGTSSETQQHPYWAFRDGNASTPGILNKPGMAINWGCVHKANLLENPTLLYCPADILWKDIFKAYATPGPWGVNNPYLVNGVIPDPRLKPTDTAMCIRVTYTYWPQSKKKVKDAARLAAIQPNNLNFFNVGYPEIALKASDLDSNKAISTDNGGHSLGNRQTNEDPKADMGYNSLWADGHVRFNPPPHCTVDGKDTVMTLRQENEDGPITRIDNAMYLFMSKLEP